MERQHNLDNLKFIAAFFVICIHLRFPQNELTIKAIARVAVPIFLMISGYFYPILRRNGKQWKYFKKIVCMGIGANFFYFLVNISISYISQSYPSINFRDLLNFLIFNEYIPFTGNHLWYFNALIYTILFVLSCDKYLHKMYFLIPILLVSTYVISSLTVNLLFYRNFLFMALPYFFLGYYIRDKEEKLKILCENKKGTIRNVVLLLLVEVLLLCAEIIIYKKIGLPVYRDFYFMTTPMVMTLFVGALYVFPNKEVKYISLIGEKYSAYIYIYHIFVINIANLFLHKFTDLDFYKLYYLNLIITLAFTIAFTNIYLKLKEYIYTVIHKCY